MKGGGVALALSSASLRGRPAWALRHTYTHTHARTQEKYPPAHMSPTYIPPHIHMYMCLHETLHRAGEGTEELLVTPLEVGLSW